MKRPDQNLDPSKSKKRMKRHAEQISLWEWEFVSGDSKGMLRSGHPSTISDELFLICWHLLRVMKGSEFTQTNTLLLHEAQIWYWLALISSKKKKIIIASHESKGICR